MKLSLVVLSAGKLEGKILEIKLAQFVIGRDPQCHLRPSSPLISKRHCALLQREGKVFIRDFDSTNGSFVNDQPLKGETELHDGDRLKVGPLLFDVRIEQAAAVNRPTPPPPTRSATPTKTAPAGQTPAPPPAKKPAVAPAAPGNAASKKPAPAPAKPEPATAAASSDSGASEGDDDIAAMLLSLQDDSSAGLSLSGSEVPEGSTVHELTVPPEVSQKLNENPPAKEKEKDKKASGNTSNAAKSILEMYMKRPRT